MRYISLFFMALCAGCLSFNFKLSPDEGSSKGKVETVLLANTNNVYRLATNSVLKVRVQKKRNGKWEECEHRVLIPEGWFIVSGEGL